jgi:hydroxymethylbilane synthase
MPSAPERIVIASRESRLALWQAEHIRDRLAKLYPQCRTTILGITTRGDQVLDRPLAKIGGKGLFVKELETALEAGKADIAVHSMKDVPMHLPDGFALAIVGEREDPRDAFVCNTYPSLARLPSGSVVGTSSLRREAQLRARFPQLGTASLRGNVETRLRKLDEGRYAAIILAAAGLKRLDLSERIRAYLSIEDSLPAVGQGALGIEYRADRADIAGILAPFISPATTACVLAERAMSRRLAGSCEVPLGGHGEIVADTLRLRGLVAAPDGTKVVRGEQSGAPERAEAIGFALAEHLLQAGADRILAQLQASA